MKNLYKFLCVALLVVTLQACSKEKETTTTTNNTTTQQQTTNSGTNTPSTTNSGTQNFSMTNNTGMTLLDVYISPNDENTWGDDVIPKDVIANGETFDFTFDGFSPDKCVWDIKFTADNGTEYIMQDVNLCQTSTITLTPQ